MFIYFRKDTRKFSHSSKNENGGFWLHEFELPNGKLGFSYILNDDDTVEEDVQLIDSNSGFVSEQEFNMQALRKLRNSKLQETDWWSCSDRVMTAAQISYRQQLRDLTKTYSNISETVWPALPE